MTISLACVIGCSGALGPTVVTDEGLVLELTVEPAPATVGSEVSVGLGLRNDGREPLTVVYGGCLAQFAISRTPGGPAEPVPVLCAAVTDVTLVLQPGDETDPGRLPIFTIPNRDEAVGTYTVEARVRYTIARPGATAKRRDQTLRRTLEAVARP